MARALVRVAVLFAVVFSASAVAARAGAPSGERVRASRAGRSIVLQVSGASGRLIHVHGGAREATLLAPEPLAAVAVRDIDFDGDLDVLATASRSGLLLWRNDGHDRFVLARPDRRKRSSSGAGMSAERAIGACLGPGDDRHHPTVLRVPGRTASFPLAHGPPSACSAGYPPQSTPASGRAPPAAC